MTRVLEVWLEGTHAGQFVHANDGAVTFTYDQDAPDTPISLSLPRDGSGTRASASNFLENILPDHDTTRARMAAAYGASSPDTFDLLHAAGGDIAGGLVILPEGEAPTPADRAELNPVLVEETAGRISSINRDPDSFYPSEVPARFSLAGTQGKFALAEIDGYWYWSNATLPSTHIIKPGNPKLHGIERAEVAALTLAPLAGVPAPVATVLNAEDQTAFMVERFDRDRSHGDIPRRLHAEDLAQSLGIGPKSKYNVSVKQVADIIGTVDDDGSILRSFLRQLTFNTLIGNADAHAKNYSLMLGSRGARLAPLYDAVPVMLYPTYDQKLAMRIAGARHPQAAGPDHWRKLARTIGVDEDEMQSIVTSVASGIREHNESAWTTLAVDQGVLVRNAVDRNVDVALGVKKPSETARTGTITVQDGVHRRKTTASSTPGSFAPKRNSAPEGELSAQIETESDG